MATGMAIMGFGGGAMIGSPLATMLMSHYATPTSPGVWETFITMGIIYFVFMLGGAFGYRLPPTGWKPQGWTPLGSSNAMITTGNVDLKDAHKTLQFWLIWAVLCLNVSAGIGIIGAASPCCRRLSVAGYSAIRPWALVSSTTRRRPKLRSSARHLSASSRSSTSSAVSFGHRCPIRSGGR
jgi:hypothetical protein